MLKRLEEMLIFLPSPESDGDWSPRGLHTQDVFFHTDDDVRLHAWYCPCPDEHPNVVAAGARPVFLMCHGNAGNLSHRAPLIEVYQRHLGVDCFMFDYRGYGKSQGRPSEEGLYRDSRAAYRWLTEVQQVSSDRIVLHGRSIGGCVALELALAVPHCCLILESTFTSLPDVAAQVYPWLPIRWMMRSRFANRDRISKYHRPVLFVHGVADTLVPVEHSRELYKLANPPKSLLEIEGAGHNDLVEFGGRRYIEELQRFLIQAFSTTDPPPENGSDLRPNV